MKKIFIGVDVSKKKLDASVILAQNQEGIPTPEYVGQFENSRGGCTQMVKAVGRKYKGIDPAEWLFCVETTGSYSRLICDTMSEKGLVIWRENALQIKWSKGVVRQKDDRTDSGIIAEYAMRHEDRCVPYVPDSKPVKELKELYAYREKLVADRRTYKNRLKDMKGTMPSGDAKDEIRDGLEKLVAVTDRLIKKAEQSMLEIIDGDPALHDSYARVTSIVGVGMVTAVGMIIHTNNFREDTDSRKFCCYCGLAPFREQSGTSVDKKAAVRHLSNLQMKATLSQAALVAIKHNPDMLRYFLRLVNSGKHRNIALNNVKCKLVHIAFSLVRNGQYYELFHEEKRKKALEQQRIQQRIQQRMAEAASLAES